MNHLRTSTVTTRKARPCFACLVDMPVGSTAIVSVFADGGSVYSIHEHPECAAAMHEMGDVEWPTEYGYGPGELVDIVREIGRDAADAYGVPAWAGDDEAVVA